MKSFHRGLLLAASVPLVLLLAAPALAATELSTYKCDDPEEAASHLYDYISDNPIDTSDFDTDDCEKLCKELNKLCNANVQNRIDCIKTDDAFYYKLQTALCDVYYTGDVAKSCKEETKSGKSFNKEVNKSLQEDGEFECEDDFGVGGFCQFDCEDGALDDD
jgi:hypothetical protein